MIAVVVAVVVAELPTVAVLVDLIADRLGRVRVDVGMIFAEKMEYKEVGLTEEFRNVRVSSLEEANLEMPQDYTKTAKNLTSGAAPSNIEAALREHSKFLSTVKNQLNRKLYQVRYQTRY